MKLRQSKSNGSLDTEVSREQSGNERNRFSILPTVELRALPGAKSKSGLPAIEHLGMEKGKGEMDLFEMVLVDKQYDPQVQRLRGSLDVVSEPSGDNGSLQAADIYIVYLWRPVKYTEDETAYAIGGISSSMKVFCKSMGS